MLHLFSSSSEVTSKASSFSVSSQLLAVFMQLDTRSLLMNYIDLGRTKNVQLTFDALLVRPHLQTLILPSIPSLSPVTGHMSPRHWSHV